MFENGCLSLRENDGIVFCSHWTTYWQYQHSSRENSRSRWSAVFSVDSKIMLEIQLICYFCIFLALSSTLTVASTVFVFFLSFLFFFSISVVSSAHPFGFAGVLQVSANGHSFSDPETTIASSLNTDFGQQTQYNPVSHTFALSVNGSSAVAVTSIALQGANAGDFFVSSPGLSAFPFIVPTTSSRSFVVQFVALAVGTRVATINISSNASLPTAHFLIDIQGFGKLSVSPCPCFCVSGVALLFSSVCLAQACP